VLQDGAKVILHVLPVREDMDFNRCASISNKKRCKPASTIRKARMFVHCPSITGIDRRFLPIRQSASGSNRFFSGFDSSVAEQKLPERRSDRKYPMGMIKNAFDWGEPFVFSVPDGQDREFFLEAGLELGETLKIGSPESVRRYAMRQDGSYYGAHLEKMFQQRREAALKAMDDAGRQQAAQAAATSGY
jgi:hypothetical protein